ncbi:MAG: flavodoxin family protein [Candidatus Omnitrophica bacterium]|nr:flavodoxin family protein [Candidatus Omnitrophota bacterium]MBU1997241.1 flavodoxin family protein [Candidatus Omnitrophota bacterium]
MNILTVHGSPDTEGNSAKLLTACINGMKKSQEVEIESIQVYDYKIEAVWKDYFADVMKKQTVKIKDDMPLLKNKMLKADIILLASPIYWYQLSGKLKLFVDRWTDFINPDFSTQLKGKGLALLSTHGGSHLMNGSDYLQLAMCATADFLGMTWMGAVDCRAKMHAEWDDGLSVEQAKLFGEKLSRGVNLIGQKVL